MKFKFILNIFIIIVTAIISALILYETLIAGYFLQEKGIIGIALASMFSHLTIIGRNLFVPAFLSLTMEYHPVLLGLSAGLGGAIGEITTYYWGLEIKKVVKQGSEDESISKWINKYGLLAILLVAASPLPDTPIILLAGSVRLSLKKFFAIEILGKVLFYSFGAVVGGLIFTNLSNSVSEILISTLIIIFSTIICFLAYWSKGRKKIINIFKKILS